MNNELLLISIQTLQCAALSVVWYNHIGATLKMDHQNGLFIFSFKEALENKYI